MFDLLQQAVDSAIASGAKYSDARILSSKSRSIQARNGDIEDFNESESIGTVSYTHLTLPTILLV